jgi:hypothetical protein
VLGLPIAARFARAARGRIGARDRGHAGFAERAFGAGR